MFTGMGTFNGGSIAIQQICADGSTGETPTNLRNISANLSAQGSNCGIFLPAGSFQIAVIGSPSNMRAAITKIPVNNVSESFVRPSLTVAGADVPFALKGGVYMFNAVCANFNSGNAMLQFLMPDGTTWQNAVDIAGTGSTISVSSTKANFWLPPGQYRFHVVGAPVAPLAVSIASVPL